MKWRQQVDMTGNPLLLLAVFLWLAGIQLVSLGLLGEVCARIYYRRDGHRPFAIARQLGRGLEVAENEERVRAA
jgi:hypothetical protein